MLLAFDYIAGWFHVNLQTSRLQESFLAIIVLEQWKVINGKSWREPCREFKIERRVVWTTRES